MTSAISPDRICISNMVFNGDAYIDIGLIIEIFEYGKLLQILGSLDAAARNCLKSIIRFVRFFGFKPKNNELISRNIYVSSQLKVVEGGATNPVLMKFGTALKILHKKKRRRKHRRCINEETIIHLKEKMILIETQRQLKHGKKGKKS